MIEKLEINFIRKSPEKLWRVSTNIGMGWGFAIIDSNENDPDNGGMICTMLYRDNDPEVLKFLEQKKLKSYLVVPADELKSAIERGNDFPFEEPKTKRRNTRRRQK